MAHGIDQCIVEQVCSRRQSVDDTRITHFQDVVDSRNASDEGGHCSLGFVSCNTVCQMFRRLFTAISNSVVAHLAVLDFVIIKGLIKEHSGKSTRIQFEGEKTHDYSIYTETNFYLDNIVYNNASCFTDSTSAPPPTSDDLLSTLVEEDNNKENQNANDEEESPKLIMIATILAVLLLVAAVVVVVLYFRRQRADGVTGSTKRSVTKDHESSIVMVNNDVYSISEGDNHTEDGIPLHEMGTPQDHTYYCMVHTLHPEPDPDVLVVHGRDNLSGSENYENFTLDKSNVKPPQSILGYEPGPVPSSSMSIICLLALDIKSTFVCVFLSSQTKVMKKNDDAIAISHSEDAAITCSL
ncbi:hypothetical protein C0Q70_04876 [Pomacea canaliculata]|uniref:Uncharacterized protein n=1 Tax=Pomacea canaliculata TaxID=400727 RepID=A0A2T7PJM6_POMCA|nr:hypothetical protein C0Q70_04876 [Pomacea canaliculata]